MLRERIQKLKLLRKFNTLYIIHVSDQRTHNDLGFHITDISQSFKPGYHYLLSFSSQGCNTVKNQQCTKQVEHDSTRINTQIHVQLCIQVKAISQHWVSLSIVLHIIFLWQHQNLGILLRRPGTAGAGAPFSCEFWTLKLRSSCWQ